VASYFVLVMAIQVRKVAVAPDFIYGTICYLVTQYTPNNVALPRTEDLQHCCPSAGRK
jgi:hypothetical protein